MTNEKTLSAVIIICATVATPVFAQDGGPLGPGSRNGLEPQPGPAYYDRGHAHLNGFAPFDEGHVRHWLEKSKPGNHSTARNPSGS